MHTRDVAKRHLFLLPAAGFNAQDEEHQNLKARLQLRASCGLPRRLPRQQPDVIDAFGTNLTVLTCLHWDYRREPRSFLNQGLVLSWEGNLQECRTTRKRRSDRWEFIRLSILNGNHGNNYRLFRDGGRAKEERTSSEMWKRLSAKGGKRVLNRELPPCLSAAASPSSVRSITKINAQMHMKKIKNYVLKHMKR